jgi:hypothetical protein
VGTVEFIELINASINPVPLYDAAHSTNTWQLNGAGFTFPAGIMLNPGELVVLAATNPAAFRAQYAVPGTVLVLGPLAGALQDSGERLQLQAPDNPNTNGTVPYVAVEEVRYNDRAPWPAEADGTGLSLQRRSTARFGNSPANWLAATPTPGRSLSVADTDNDGLPDLWEVEHGTSQFVPDADQDLDGDGMSNRHEYLAGTNPADGASTLQLELLVNSGARSLRFLAMSNRTYSVQSRTNLISAPWLTMTNVSLAPASRMISVPLQTTGSAAFYRLVTPAQP